MEQYRKTPKCYVCGKNTNGCFNKAKEIIERLEKKHQMNEAIHDDDDDDDDNDDENENDEDDNDNSDL